MWFAFFCWVRTVSPSLFPLSCSLPEIQVEPHGKICTWVAALSASNAVCWYLRKTPKFLAHISTIIVCGSVWMSESLLVLECPYCDAILEVRPPDKLHSAYSTKKPLSSSYHGDVIQQKIPCKNKECKKPITVYWYSPMDYFNRM